jgi:hypothetical protein
MPACAGRTAGACASFAWWPGSWACGCLSWWTLTSPNSAERAELALIDTGAESVTADPAAGDGAAVAQDASEPIRGRDRPLWWKIRREAPPPPEPHPAPLEPMEAGPWVEKTRARGWSTLPARLGPGWELRSGRAVGWEIMARKRGALVETVSVQARLGRGRRIDRRRGERRMKITMVLQVEDPDDVDEGHSMGITNDAYDRLYEAVTDAGFAWVDGPTASTDEEES